MFKVMFLNLLLIGQATFAISTKEVSYTWNKKTMTGYMALPEKVTSKTPGILVVHEWWGQTDYPRRRARMLAKMGYAAFAVDMYGNRKITDHPKKAGEFSSQALADAKTAGSRFEAARKAFVKAGKLSDSKLAAIGYCFGGSVVIEMARQGRNLAGVVSFHGGLVTPSKAKKGKIKAKLLVLNGASDKMITAAHISDFKKEMKSAGADFEFISYQGALHGFTNPEATANGKRLGFPLAYNKDADLKSWNKMSGFLKTIF